MDLKYVLQEANETVEMSYNLGCLWALKCAFVDKKINISQIFKKEGIFILAKGIWEHVLT